MLSDSMLVFVLDAANGCLRAPASEKTHINKLTGENEKQLPGVEFAPFSKRVRRVPVLACGT